MKAKIIISIFGFMAFGASAQLSIGSSADYKHPQLAAKAKKAEQEALAKDKSTTELVFDKNSNYKDQTNNRLKVIGRKRKSNESSPSNTDPNRKADYKHSNGLSN